MKTTNFGVASLMVIAAMGTLFAPTASADNECSDSNRGAGTEPVSCDDVSCLEGEHFLVDITSSNNNDDVEAEGGCDTANTECESSYGQCGQWSTTPTTTASHGGECSGSAEVGAHGSVDLYCKSGSSSNDLAFGAIRKALASGDCESAAQQAAALPTFGSFAVHMTWSDGQLRTTKLVQGECESKIDLVVPIDGVVSLNF